MTTITVGPDGHMLVDGKQVNPWGTAGSINFARPMGVDEAGNLILPEGMQQQIDAGYIDANGDYTAATRQALGNRVQLNGSGIGGHAEAIDPSKVDYDPRFGFVTDPSNIKAPASGLADTLAQGVRIATPLLIGAGAAGAFGFGPFAEGSSLAGGASGSDALSEILANGTTGVGPVASGVDYGNLLDILANGTSGIGPVADGGAYGSMPAGALPGPPGGLDLGAGGLSPEEMGAGNYAAGAGLPGTGTSMLDRLMSVARALPGVTSALSGGKQPSRAGAGASAGIGGFGGAGQMRASPVQMQTNPWLKAKPTDVLDLMSYVRGVK